MGGATSGCWSYVRPSFCHNRYLGHAIGSVQYSAAAEESFVESKGEGRSDLAGNLYFRLPVVAGRQKWRKAEGT
jgi:hypothetical protein